MAATGAERVDRGRDDRDSPPADVLVTLRLIGLRLIGIGPVTGAAGRETTVTGHFQVAENLKHNLKALRVRKQFRFPKLGVAHIWNPDHLA
jgi:hypothetical protein